METEKRKIFGKAGNNKLKMLAVVPAALAVVLMLVLASGFVQVPTATVTKEKLAEESHCPVCDYLQAQYSGEGDQWYFNGSQDDFNETYGGENGRAIWLSIFSPQPYCPGGSAVDAIIAEYEATGSLDGYFAPLYSYGISISSDISISQATPSQHLGRILFDATPVGGGIGGTSQITAGDGISQTVVKTHYTSADLGITYAEIYQRALDTRAYLNGGAYPSWAGNDPPKTNAIIDCIQFMMAGAGIAKCVIAPFILLSPILFGLPILIEILQVFANHPNMGPIAQAIFNTCVALVSAFRAGTGLPP